MQNISHHNPAARGWTPPQQPESHQQSSSKAVSPASSGPRVTILGFQSNTELREASEAGEVHPYRFSGHVGYSFDGGDTIFGFGPTRPEGATAKDMFARLLKKETFPGKITDDTHVFRDVYNRPTLAGSTKPQIVYEFNPRHAPMDVMEAMHNHLSYQLGRPIEEVRYGFPYPAFGDNVRNCATFPATLGVTLPHDKGNLQAYIPKLIEKSTPWEPAPEHKQPTQES